MGLITSRVKLLLNAHNEGVNFSSTLTLGRQKISVSSNQFTKLKKKYNLPSLENENFDDRPYADDFFYKFLNVKKLSILDYSSYQGADIVHDMNIPIKSNLESKYDVIIDGGTLEHIFNFPVAIENCMKMLKVGGSLFIFSMANNHCGHGFYQFSPELFFRIFQKNNGFYTNSIILVRHPYSGAELSERQEMFLVKDPAIVGKRSSLVTKTPLGIMVHAIKKSEKALFVNFPQQSDYVKSWGKKNLKKSQTRQTLKSKTLNIFMILYNKFPKILKNKIFGIYQLWIFSLDRNKKAFKKID